MLKDKYREKLNYCLVKCLSILPNNSILILNEFGDTLRVIFQNLHLNKIFWFTFHSVLSACNNIILGWENEIFLWWCWRTAIYMQILAFTSGKMHYFKSEQENKLWGFFKNSPQKTQEEEMSGIIKQKLASYWWATPPSQEDLFYSFFFTDRRKKISKHPICLLLITFPPPHPYCFLL